MYSFFNFLSLDVEVCHNNGTIFSFNVKFIFPQSVYLVMFLIRGEDIIF